MAMLVTSFNATAAEGLVFPTRLDARSAELCVSAYTRKFRNETGYANNLLIYKMERYEYKDVGKVKNIIDRNQRIAINNIGSICRTEKSDVIDIMVLSVIKAYKEAFKPVADKVEKELVITGKKEPVQQVEKELTFLQKTKKFFEEKAIAINEKYARWRTRYK